MKRTSLVAASILLAFTGCTCGQGWRPNILGRLHDKIHGVNNVGAPCLNGGCASAPVMAAPAIADAGCETCGSGVQTMGYEGYPTTSYGGEFVGESYGGVIHNAPVVGGVSGAGVGGEYIQGQRVQ